MVYRVCTKGYLSRRLRNMRVPIHEDRSFMTPEQVTLTTMAFYTSVTCTAPVHQMLSSKEGNPWSSCCPYMSFLHIQRTVVTSLSCQRDGGTRHLDEWDGARVLKQCKRFSQMLLAYMVLYLQSPQALVSPQGAWCDSYSALPSHNLSVKGASWDMIVFRCRESHARRESIWESFWADTSDRTSGNIHNILALACPVWWSLHQMCCYSHLIFLHAFHVWDYLARK